MKFIVLLPLFLFSCAHGTKPKLPSKPYMKDQVSVKTVLMQAHSAYLRGCLDGHKEANKEKKTKEKKFKFCKAKADEYLEKDVISILEQ